MTQCDFEFSKELDPDGNPLFAAGNVSFETYRIVTYEEWSEFFVGRRAELTANNFDPSDQA